MPSRIYSVELNGLEGRLVEIEVDTRSGIPCFTIVGLPDTAVQEARERVRSAMKNSELPFPRGKVIINLAPANVRKVGSRYDLAIALGIASLCELIPAESLKGSLFLGELALNGQIRPVMGIISAVEFAKKNNFKTIFLPKENMAEALLIKGVELVPVEHLKEALAYLQGERPPFVEKGVKKKKSPHFDVVDMSLIRGQAQAKRAMEIAAAGGHNLILNGAPGAGKTMLAQALNGILPAMSEEEMLEVTKIYSVSGLLRGSPIIHQRPFRNVHHTASLISLSGGGLPPLPGEMTLAHRGVLFLDEIAEFPTSTLESLRQPMEDGQIIVSRAKVSVTYPARFMLVAAMNPCPCGYYNSGSAERTCSCPAWKIQKYRKKLSGPLLDRIDLHLKIEPVPHRDLVSEKTGETSDIIRTRVERAASMQVKRFIKFPFRRNAEMKNEALNLFCPLSSEAKKLLDQAASIFHLSARGYFKTIRVARTIADLDQKDIITEHHVAEALQYRKKD